MGFTQLIATQVVRLPMSTGGEQLGVKWCLAQGHMDTLPGPGFKPRQVLRPFSYGLILGHRRRITLHYVPVCYSVTLVAYLDNIRMCLACQQTKPFKWLWLRKKERESEKLNWKWRWKIARTLCLFAQKVKVTLIFKSRNEQSRPY